MTHTTDESGITFAVDDVTPATERLEECRAHEAVRRMLESDIESCCDYHGTVVAGVHYQPLLAAVYLAFSGHRPLVLTPDAVWITIAQGVAQHMVLHGERLRPRFVSHQGKLELAFTSRGWVEGSPENPWPEAFASWSGQIRQHVGPDLHDRLVCDFSTTGPIERAVSEIVLMDVFRRYFHYAVYCICGIPTVTLEGTPADWERLRDKAAGLRVFEMDWWLDHLLPICDQFVRASRGDIDLPHWQGICKLRDNYGGHIINGWVARLFPYLRAFIKGPCSRRNPIFETGEGFQTLVAPSGLSRVSFMWNNAMTGTSRAMEAIGGLLGVTQDEGTMALRPKVGWAVRPADRLDTLLGRLELEHTTFDGAEWKESEDGRQSRRTGLPTDLSAFYDRTNGAELTHAGAVALRILPIDAMRPLDWGELPEIANTRGPGGRIWHRFAELPDGSWLAINLDPNVSLAFRGDPELRQACRDRESFAPICHGFEGSEGRQGRNRVIALSFTELLEGLLNDNGKPYWLDPGFKDFGYAERFTRRC